MTAAQGTADHDRTALITGAARGIGYELTKLFARDGYDVVLVDLRQDRLMQISEQLEETHNITATDITQDLAVPNAAQQLYDATTAADIRVDTLVNNAGIATHGRFCETEWERERKIIQLNVTTATELTKHYATPMCERGTGQILNVASLMGRAPSPLGTVYGAAKSYLISFSVALANELAEDGVTVSVLCPGETDTALLETGGVQHSALPEKDLRDPEEVALSGYTGLQQGDTIVVPGGIKEKLFYHLPRVLPQTTAASVARSYLEKE